MQSNFNIINKLTFIGLLHSGGEANVYKALYGAKEYIFKSYHNDIKIDEATISKLLHAHVKGAYNICEYGIQNNSAYLLYDFINGISSSECKQMPLAVALTLMRQVVQTLLQLKISHGDLNPANILLCPKKDSLEIAIIDFGIIGPGTLAYAAPERINGNIPTEKSDLYSLSLLLYHWICGKDLFASDIYKNIKERNNINCDILCSNLNANGYLTPAEISAILPLLNYALQVVPENRPENLDEFDEMLELALSNLKIGALDALFAIKKFAKTLPLPKEPKKCASPIHKKNAHIKFIAICAIILITIIAIVLALNFNVSNIDATGKLFIENSRTLQIQKDAPNKTLPQNLLNDLPTPTINQ